MYLADEPKYKIKRCLGIYPDTSYINGMLSLLFFIFIVEGSINNFH